MLFVPILVATAATAVPAGIAVADDLASQVVVLNLPAQARPSPVRDLVPTQRRAQIEEVRSLGDALVVVPHRGWP
jgi:hypothetical protein